MWNRALVVLSLIGLGLAQAAYAHEIGPGRSVGFPPRQDDRTSLWQLLPAGLDAETEAGMRGIIDKSVMWEQNQRIVVCFRSGTRKARARVAAIAAEWMNFVNLKLDFGTMNDPRQCSGQNSEDIKIGFVTTGVDYWYWSYIGTVSRKYEHSMNLHELGEDEPPTNMSSQKLRFKILHEFGHALGFEHEHQRPDLNCEAEFDPDALARWAAGVGWREADIRVNLRKLNPQGREVSARHDKQSIMHYSLAPEILRDGTSNRCWVAENLDLSEGDKEFARAQYPLPVAAATANNASAEHRTSRPAAPPDPKQAEVQRQATLKAELAQVLKKGRVPDSDAAKVVDAFAAEVARLRSAPSR